jgi:hypothetical protein
MNYNGGPGSHSCSEEIERKSGGPLNIYIPLDEVNLMTCRGVFGAILIPVVVDADKRDARQKLIRRQLS